MSFNEHDHARLATLFDGVRCHPPRYDGRVCQGKPIPYPGYRPEVREAPNGDTKSCGACEILPAARHNCPFCHGTGRVPNVDAEGVCDHDGVSAADCARCSGTGRTPAKRYLHVAPKYNPPAWALMYLARAHYEACRVAEALNVPAAYYPRVADGTLRVLEYPPGAGTVEHTDFNLLTIVLWRSTPEDLERAYAEDLATFEARGDAEAISPGLHIGELGELVGLGPATPHRVPARTYAQKSIVYFAMPDHGAVLPGEWHTADDLIRRECRPGPTVGQWLKERVARSRY